MFYIQNLLRKKIIEFLGLKKSKEEKVLPEIKKIQKQLCKMAILAEFADVTALVKTEIKRKQILIKAINVLKVEKDDLIKEVRITREELDKVIFDLCEERNNVKRNYKREINKFEKERSNLLGEIRRVKGEVMDLINHRNMLARNNGN